MLPESKLTTFDSKKNIRNRLFFVDHMKAIGIVAIVIGHAPGISPLIEIFLYGFHVPLFFIITGILLSESKLNTGVTEYVVRLVNEILIPYAIFFIISYAYWLISNQLSNSAERYAKISWYEPIWGFFMGIGSSLYVNVVLWFFPALFFSKLFYFLIRKRLNISWAAFWLIVLAFAHALIFEKYNFRIFFGIDCALYGASFIAIGHRLRVLLVEISKNRNNHLIAFLAIVSGILFVILASENGKADLNNVYVGSFILYITTALIGCCSIFFVSCLFDENRFSVWLSSNTLVIFPLHFLFFRVMTGVLKIFFDISSPYKTGEPGWALLYSLFGILLVIPAIKVLNKLPFKVFSKV